MAQIVSGPAEHKADGTRRAVSHACRLRWLGNSPRVAARHYLQVTDAHFDAATGSLAPNKTSAMLHPSAVSHPRGRTASQRPSESSKNYDLVRRRGLKSGRDRTRICDLLHVKQAL